MVANSVINQNNITPPVKHDHIFPENATCFDYIIHHQAKYRFKNKQLSISSKTEQNHGKP